MKRGFELILSREGSHSTFSAKTQEILSFSPRHLKKESEFLKEMEWADQLAQEGIAPPSLYHGKTQDGTSLWIVPGNTEEASPAAQRCTVEGRWKICSQLVQQVLTLHGGGRTTGRKPMLHGDLKPSNVVVRLHKTAEDIYVPENTYLIDFGTSVECEQLSHKIQSLAPTRATAESMIQYTLGTIRYQSPEWLRAYSLCFSIKNHRAQPERPHPLKKMLECFQGMQETQAMQAGDLWSLGVSLLEIIDPERFTQYLSRGDSTREVFSGWMAQEIEQGDDAGQKMEAFWSRYIQELDQDTDRHVRSVASAAKALIALDPLQRSLERASALLQSASPSISLRAKTAPPPVSLLRRVAYITLCILFGLLSLTGIGLLLWLLPLHRLRHPAAQA